MEMSVLLKSQFIKIIHLKYGIIKNGDIYAHDKSKESCHSSDFYAPECFKELIIPSKITRLELYKLFDDTLTANGFTSYKFTIH